MWGMDGARLISVQGAKIRPDWCLDGYLIIYRALQEVKLLINFESNFRTTVFVNMADVQPPGERLSNAVLAVQLSSPEPELESLRPKSAFEQCLEKDGLQSPIVRAFTRNMMRKWRDRIADKWELRMQEMKAERKKRSAESEEMTRLITRSVPIDLLAREWLDDNEITLDVRTYLIENLLPTLILAVEKLLLEVQKRGLAETEAFAPDFNPINYLAQNLMRNNPRYSHFAEASPYAKGLRQVADDLKKEIFSIGDNKLAKLKDEANRRRSALEKQEQEKNREHLRRMMALEEQFPDWTADWNGVLPLAVVRR